MVFNSELQQNLFYALFLLLVHNLFAIIFSLALLLSILFSLYKPSRAATLLIVGFASLLFSFEYSKHIVEGLREQTINSVITTQPHYKLERLISVSISKLVPFLLNVTGTISLGIATILLVLSHKKRR